MLVSYTHTHTHTHAYITASFLGSLFDFLRIMIMNCETRPDTREECLVRLLIPTQHPETKPVREPPSKSGSFMEMGGGG
jgi:hypothetical protein